MLHLGLWEQNWYPEVSWWPRGCICSLTVHLTHMSWHPRYHVGRQAPCFEKCTNYCPQSKFICVLWQFIDCLASKSSLFSLEHFILPVSKITLLTSDHVHTLNRPDQVFLAVGPRGLPRSRPAFGKLSVFNEAVNVHLQLFLSPSSLFQQLCWHRVY